MGKGTLLNDVEIGKIVALYDEGRSERYIADKLKRSKTAVHNFIVNQNSYRAAKPTGRPRIISERESRHILRLISNEPKSCAQVKHCLGLNCHRSTILRAVRTAEHLDFRKANLKPPLLETHVHDRLAFATKYIDYRDQWLTVMFSDEKKFNLDGPDGFKYYWHDLRKEPRIFSKRQFGGGSIMVWAGISFNGCTDIAYISTRENSINYIETLERFMIPQFYEFCGLNGVFQQDNAAIHSSNLTRTWFSDKGINLMAWPSRSPDLNPIENIWADLSRLVYRNGRQFNSVSDLKHAIDECWSSIEPDRIQNVIMSMKDRLIEVMSKKGGVTHY